MSADSSARAVARPASQAEAVAVLSIGLFTLLAGVYLLSYSGIYHSNDEVGYVRDAVEIVRDSPFRLGRSGPFAALLAGGLALLQPIESVGSLQPLFLINIASSALAAVFLFLLGLELGYDRRAALLVALLFGLATPAWVYSKLLFRDPFVAAALAAMAYFLVRFRNHASLASLGLAFLSGATAIGARISVAIAAPFALAYVLHCFRSRPRAAGSRLRLSKPVAIAILAALVLVVAAVVVTVFLLYAKWFDRLIRFFEHWDALAGLLISPGRGLLFFAPVIVLALAGLVRFARRHPWEALLLYGPIPFYLLMVSAHPMWWGGWNWGPRYLVPFLPYLIFPAISLIEPLVTEGSRRWLLAPLAAIVLLSVVSQLVGAAVGPNTASFENMEPATFYDWAYTPLAYLPVLGRLNPDLAWLHADGVRTQIAVVAPAVALVVAGVLLMGLALKRGAGSGLLAAAIGLLALTAGIAGWSVFRYATVDARYQTPRGYAAALQHIAEQAQPEDVVVYDHWETDDYHVFPSRVDNACRAQCPPTQEIIRREWEMTPVSLKVRWLDRLRWNEKRIWLLPASPLSEGDLVGEVEPWLDMSMFKAGCQLFSEDTELCLYYNLTPSEEIASPAFPPASLGGDRRLFLPLVLDGQYRGRDPRRAGVYDRSLALNSSYADSFLLNGARLYWRSPDPELPQERIFLRPGEPLFVDLVWQPIAPISARYKTSLQVLDAAGALVYQVDREPVDGLMPTDAWQPTQAVSDRQALVMPAALPAGDYQLLLVVYDSATGARLPTQGSDSLKLADFRIGQQP